MQKLREPSETEVEVTQTVSSLSKKQAKTKEESKQNTQDVSTLSSKFWLVHRDFGKAVLNIFIILIVFYHLLSLILDDYYEQIEAENMAETEGYLNDNLFEVYLQLDTVDYILLEDLIPIDNRLKKLREYVKPDLSTQIQILYLRTYNKMLIHYKNSMEIEKLTNGINKEGS